MLGDAPDLSQLLVSIRPNPLGRAGIFLHPEAVSTVLIEQNRHSGTNLGINGEMSRQSPHLFGG